VLQCVAVDACLQLAQVLHLLPLLQCAAAATPVAVCCSVLQCAAVCCSVLQCVVLCCSVLQCVAVRCSLVQCVLFRCSVLQLTYSSVRASTPSSSAPLTHHFLKKSALQVILYIKCSSDRLLRNQKQAEFLKRLLTTAFTIYTDYRGDLLRNSIRFYIILGPPSVHQLAETGRISQKNPHYYIYYINEYRADF